MIVRDEAHIIRESLDCAAPHIDRWVIVDTGSRDDTAGVIERRMAEHGLPGELHRRDWRDFATNRTEALALCTGQADYAWVLDADDVVVGELDLTGLTADAYQLRFGPGTRYWRTQLFRDGLRWRYEGVVHEYPVCDDPIRDARLEGDYEIQSRRLGARSGDPRTYERDAALLRTALDADPSDARSAFYLGQSLYDAGDVAGALEAYTTRAGMGGWDEERCLALLRRAECLERLGEPWPQVLDSLLRAYEARPARAEPLERIARHYRAEGSHALGYDFARRAREIPYPEADTLFVDEAVYAWRTTDEQSVCAYYLGRHAEALDLASALLAGTSLPEPERARIVGNRELSVEHVREQRSAYPAAIVQRLGDAMAGQANPEPDADVTLTITTCRRRALFERTINSFLNCCEDLSRVARFVCVDNGSSPADLERMRDRYPFFEFVVTDPDRDGHAGSMNRILDLVATPLWLHLEDDWEFFARGPYIERAAAILDAGDQLAQIAFNRSYAETLEERDLVGGRVATAGGWRYREHEYLPRDGAEWRSLVGSLAPDTLTNAYWPHFTLRPSLMATERVKAVGTFAPEGHFELAFAQRYTAAGLRTAFFDEVNCVHIGRLTRGAAEDGAPSAYTLVRDGSHAAHPVEGGGWPDRIRVVNLDRRTDRWLEFRRRATAAGGPELLLRCERFSAVDADTLEPSAELHRLFRDNDFGYRRSFVAAALSHMAIWREAAEREETTLVLEDDVTLCEGFDDRLRSIGERAAETSFDLLYLGELRWGGLAPHVVAATAPHPGLREMDWDGYVGGLYAYVVTPLGARRLLEIAERDGIQNGIDVFIAVHHEELRALETETPLAGAEFADPRATVDSDIQYDTRELFSGDEQPAALLHELAASAQVGRISLDVDPAWPVVSASVEADGDGVRIVARTADGPADPLDYEVWLGAAYEVERVAPVAVAGAARGPSSVSVGDSRLELDVTEEGATRLVLRDESGASKATPAFDFAGLGAETAFGMARRSGQLVVVFGADDEGMGLAVVDEAEILGLLEPC